MSEIATFAVGSLFPELIDKEADLNDWATEVERTLDLIPSVSRIEIDPPRGFMSFNLGDATEFKDLIQHAIPIGGEIRFHILIPARIQERIKGWSVSAGNSVEEFLVTIDLSTTYPCAFIIPLGEGVLRPSGAVIVVREFLTEELDKLGSKAAIKLTTLGPSPFHAEFHIKEGDVGEILAPGIRVSRAISSGYSRWTLHYDPEVHESAEAARTVIIQRLGYEFSTFYRIVAHRNIHRFGVAAIEAWVEGTLAFYGGKGLKSWIYRTAKLRKILHDISLEILKVQLGIEKVHKQNERLIEKARDRNSKLALEKELAEKAELGFRDELSSYAEMVGVLESRHSNTTQRLTSFAVSLLGVVVGALLTAALRK
ncbi:hypothetical protein [Streptomyces goshikiensis]|uniref:hypothetical protein n=1 Tax=Streptomyces goshikiensis TaxID=1942 RepID=UPI0033B32581